VFILGIETSGKGGGVAVCEDDCGRVRMVADCTLAHGLRRERDIMVAIDGVLKEAGLKKSDVEAVAVSEGPGAFTGLRVGITCAKVLAYALGWKAVGVPSLLVKAQNVDGAGPGAPEFVCPVIDARRSWVFATLFRWDDGRWQALTGVLGGPPEQVAAHVPEGTLVFGSGCEKYPSVFAAPRFRIGEAALEEGRAHHVARLGARLLREGKAVSPFELVPRYYRPTAPEESFSSGDATNWS